VFNLLLITGGIIVCSLVLGMLLALLLHRSFPLQPLARSLAITPFFVMPTVNAVVWKNLLLNPIFGFVSWLTTSVGLPRVDILATYPKLGIITIAVWQWTPFMMLVLLAGLQSVPKTSAKRRVDRADAMSNFARSRCPCSIRISNFACSSERFTSFSSSARSTSRRKADREPRRRRCRITSFRRSRKATTSASSAQGVCAVILASVIAAFLLRLLVRTFSVAKA
jgi:sorbitol/mannitol transport system permease protein